jgi:hypothetical protein
MEVPPVTPSSTTSTRRREARAALDQSPTVHRTRLLEHAVELLEAATEADDTDLAQTCRGVLDALRTHGARDAIGPDALPAPEWASRTIHEDGGIVHETISPLHPTIDAGDDRLWPTDVSLSAADRLANGSWVRAESTIQVEGGSYPLSSAQRLRTALDELLNTATKLGTSTP